MKIVYSLLILTFFACKKDIDYSYRYDGDRLVVNGFIATNKAEITISKSFPVTDNTYSLEDARITDAQVILYQMDSVLDTLSYNQTTQEYNYSKTLELDRNEQYKIGVSHPNFNPVYSDFLTFPDLPYAHLSLKSYTQEEQRGKIALTLDTLPKNPYLLIITNVVRQNEALKNPGTSIEYGEDENYRCVESTNSNIASAQLIDVSCLGLNHRALKISFNLKDHRTEESYKKLILRYTTLSTANYDLLKPVYEFGETPQNFSIDNINGGYGVLIASDFKSIEIDL